MGKIIKNGIEYGGGSSLISMAPDYAGAISLFSENISTAPYTFTAPSNGVLYLNVALQPGAAGYVTGHINGVKCLYCQNVSSGSQARRENCVIIMKEGDILTIDQIVNALVCSFTAFVPMAQHDVTSLSGSSNMRWNPETDMVQIFNGSEWIDWKVANMLATYIYKNGVVNVPLVAVGTLGSSGSSTFDTDVIIINSISAQGSGRRQAVRTTGTLSLTNVDRLYIDYSTTLGNGRLFVTISSTAVDNPYGSGTIVGTQELVTGESHSIFEVDLSTYSGSYYVYIGVLTHDTATGLTSTTNIHTISYK